MGHRKQAQGLFNEKTARIELPFDLKPPLTEMYYLKWKESSEIVAYCAM